MASMRKGWVGALATLVSSIGRLIMVSAKVMHCLQPSISRLSLLRPGPARHSPARHRRRGRERPSAFQTIIRLMTGRPSRSW